MPTPARRLAHEVLSRAGRGGPTLSESLAETDRERLSTEDRALLHELVYGTLRHRGWLDHVLQGLVARPLDRSPPPLLDALRIGAYQLLFLRVPDHAAVSESVSLARSVEPRGAGFVNAVLRRLQREGPPPEPSAERDPLGWLTTMGSLPRWLAARWLERCGAAEAVARGRALLEPPPVCVHFNPNVPDAPSRATAAGLEVRPATVPGAWEVTAGRPGDLAARGVLHIQDEGSQLVAALAAHPGRVLDACAAPGGKSLLLAERLGRGGRVVAGDVSLRRVQTLVAIRSRWGASRLDIVAADALRPPFRGLFDAVLLDAPCSGLGTLARHPDIRWRVRPGDPARHARKQLRLIEAVSSLVAIGGRLVYSACSVEDEETLGVVEPFLRSHPGFGIEELPAWSQPFASGPFVRMSPSRHRGDAFFAARLRRSA